MGDQAGGDDEGGEERRAPAGRAHRGHVRPGRPRRVQLRLSDDEHARLAEAAARAGLTPAGYAAEAALAAAQGVAAPASVPLKEALVEVMRTRTQRRRVGANLNQAVAALDAAGHAPSSLAPAAERADQALRRLDAAALAKALR